MIRIEPALDRRKGIVMRIPSRSGTVARVALPLPLLGLLGLLAAGAAPAGDASATPPPYRLGAAAPSFNAELRACQTAVGGRLDQRRRLDASQPRVAACLRQRGWNVDGTPSLDRLLAPG